MKQNHFIVPYMGNKKNEADEFISKANFDDVENIFEVFCGTSAISFNIWLKFKNKFNYYLNDKSRKLIELYEVLKTKSIDEIENQIKQMRDTIKTKKDWDEYFKDSSNEDVFKFIYYSKYSNRNIYGLFPLNDERHIKASTFKITEYQTEFIEFLKSPNVFISCGSWFDLFDKHKNNDKCMFILDPPYIDACNDFYLEKDLNMYEFFYHNKLETFKSKIYLILKDFWIIRMLFSNNKIISQYNKNYVLSKRKINHIIIEK